MIDLDVIESRINDGIYGDDRMTDTARDDAFSALAVLLAEVERLRARRAYEEGRNSERAAVVAWLRVAWGAVNLVSTEIVSAEIERGEHRRGEGECGTGRVR